MTHSVDFLGRHRIPSAPSATSLSLLKIMASSGLLYWSPSVSSCLPLPTLPLVVDIFLRSLLTTLYFFTGEAIHFHGSNYSMGAHMLIIPNLAFSELRWS